MREEKWRERLEKCVFKEAHKHLFIGIGWVYDGSNNHGSLKKINNKSKMHTMIHREPPKEEEPTMSCSEWSLPWLAKQAHNSHTPSGVIVKNEGEHLILVSYLSLRFKLIFQYSYLFETMFLYNSPHFKNHHLEI